MRYIIECNHDTWPITRWKRVGTADVEFDLIEVAEWEMRQYRNSTGPEWVFRVNTI